MFTFTRQLNEFFFPTLTRLIPGHRIGHSGRKIVVWGGGDILLRCQRFGVIIVTDKVIKIVQMKVNIIVMIMDMIISARERIHSSRWMLNDMI